MLSPRAGTTVEAEENLVRASLGRMMLTTDGDEHARLRAPFERPFRMRDVGELFGDAVAAEAERAARRRSSRQGAASSARRSPRRSPCA